MSEHKWISTDTRHPKVHQRVLIVAWGRVRVAERVEYASMDLSGHWRGWVGLEQGGEQFEEEDVTHWMPLPSPPTPIEDGYDGMA